MKQCEFEKMYSEYNQHRDYIVGKCDNAYKAGQLSTKCYNEFFNKIKNIENVEENIKEYLEKANTNQIWKPEYQEIMSFALELNNELFIPVLLDIIRDAHDDYDSPVYYALDTLMYMECYVSEEAIEKLCDIINSKVNNWSDVTIEKAFQLFAWRDTEVGLKYLKENCKNDNKLVEHYANYWYSFLQDDDE